MTGDEEKFWSICTTNSYIPTSPPPSASSTSPASREVSLYSQISLINHSCIPNAMWSWVSGDVRRSQVRALRDIQKDEEILGSYYDTTEFNYGSRQFRRQKLLEKPGFWCECSECSQQGEEKERKRQEIRDLETEGFHLERCVEFHDLGIMRRDTEKILKIAQLKMNLVKELGIRQMFVTELFSLYVLAHTAKMMGISAPDPDIFNRVALNYAKKYGETQMYHYNRFLKSIVAKID